MPSVDRDSSHTWVKALLVEGDLDQARLLKTTLGGAGPVRFDLTHEERLDAALKRLSDEAFDVVLLAVSKADPVGLEGLDRVQAKAPGVPVVVLSDTEDDALAVRAVQQGAQDCIVKGNANPELLSRAIRYAIERQRAEEFIHHQARHDGLTGLPNRTLLHERLRPALAQARRENRVLAVMFLDLDHFKTVNDTLGHVVGDMLLQGVGERLMGCVRAGDTVARFGGDEFTLLLAEIARPEDAASVAERILSALRPPFLCHGHELFVTASIGVSLYPNDGDTAEALLKNSDAAMYRAKKKGRNGYEFFVAAMNARASERLAVGNSLRHALEKGELFLHFQPQVDLRSGRIVGAEALVRWRHPERGLVLPGEFIPVAEEIGLIVPIGEHVLMAACAQIRRWQTPGAPPLRVAVNLSNRQLNVEGLKDRIGRILSETGLDPALLELELTESGVMRSEGPGAATLRDLSTKGVRIAIDDFGTGYSSLALLRRLPINVLKIDQSFIRDVTSSPDDATIVRTIIGMAHTLRLEVIAEGVETAEQFEFLRDHGCEVAQGFFIARPMPAAEFEDLLRSERTRRGEWQEAAVALSR